MNNLQNFQFPTNCSVKELRRIYIQKVKQCHPDKFTSAYEQEQAQIELTNLNAAYEQALKSVHSDASSFLNVKEKVQEHINKNNYCYALFLLKKDDVKDAQWHYLYGVILMHTKEYALAHSEFRSALQFEPDNRQFHKAAFDAAILYKRNTNIWKKTFRSIQKALHFRRKN